MEEARTTTTADPLAHPMGSDELVLQVTTGGGFVPIEYNLTSMPEFSLYGDGRVIVSGPVDAIYPGPALPNLQTTVVSEDVIVEILSAAQEAGLLRTGVDYGQPGIADGPTTTFVINVGGTSFRSDIYALGMDSGDGNLTAEQQQARAIVQDLRSNLVDLTGFVSEPPSWAPYEYSALAVFSRAVDPTAGPGGTDVMPNVLDWPLADLSTAGSEVMEGVRKIVVSGEDLDTLRPLLSQATQISLWRSGGSSYNLSFRPLLPDEMS